MLTYRSPTYVQYTVFRTQFRKAEYTYNCINACINIVSYDNTAYRIVAFPKTDEKECNFFKGNELHNDMARPNNEHANSKSFIQFIRAVVSHNIRACTSLKMTDI